jgi:hypothetical protein
MVTLRRSLVKCGIGMLLFLAFSSRRIREAF